MSFLSCSVNGSVCLVSSAFDSVGETFRNIYEGAYYFAVECYGSAGVEDGECVDGMSAGHENLGGTRDSGIMSNAADVIEMSVVREMKGVGGVCEMCMCLAPGGVGGDGSEWIRGFCLGFTNPVG